MVGFRLRKHKMGTKALIFTILNYNNNNREPLLEIIIIMTKRNRTLTEKVNTESNPFRRSCTRTEQGPIYSNLAKPKDTSHSEAFQSRTG